MNSKFVILVFSRHDIYTVAILGLVFTNPPCHDVSLVFFRVTLDLLSAQANTGPKWHNKSSLAFWRGRDSRQERLDLVRLSRKMPDVIDAKLTNMFFFKHKEDLGEIVKHISFFDFFKVHL